MPKQSLKFLIIGITGDLSKRKILPALSEFAYLNKDKVNIELHGYSRSEVSKSEIAEILGKNSTIKNLNFIQGEYSDPKYFQTLTENLGKDERLIVYFAVPPIVFLDLLDTFCPYYKANLDIIIEKPFGRDIFEAEKILEKIKNCKLENNVHFCDHYLFKEATNLTQNTKEKIKEFTSNKKIKSITIQALEKVDVKGRGGYYDQIGAIKDMFPAHIFSLLELVFENILEKEINKNFEIKKVSLGQYIDYHKDVNIIDSKTETYFKINSFTEENIEIIFESGKKLPEKQTVISITFDDNSNLIWNIDPNHNIILDNEKIEFNNLKKLDHTNMFEDILNNKSDRFFKSGNTLIGWQMYEKIHDFINKTNALITKY